MTTGQARKSCWRALSIFAEARGAEIYVKLFSSIYQGTLRGNSHCLLVFTNLLAHCDKEGIVDVHPRAVSEEVGLTVEQVRAALDVLEAPDEESRSPEEDGRRIVRTDAHRAWGWRVVNYAKYRAIRSEEDRREQNRVAQAKFRQRKQSKQSKPASAAESHGSAQSAQAEGEVEGEGKKYISTASPSHAAKASKVDAFTVFWEAYPKKRGKDAAAKAFAKRGPSTDMLDDMLRAIEQQKAGSDWRRDGGQYIPHPSTWLNEGRWMDEPTRAMPQMPRLTPAETRVAQTSPGLLAPHLRAAYAAQPETVDVTARRLD